MKIEEHTHPDLEKLGSLLEGSRIAMMATMDEDERLVSHLMSPLKMDEQGDVSFFVDSNSSKIQKLSIGIRPIARWFVCLLSPRLSSRPSPLPWASTVN